MVTAVRFKACLHYVSLKAMGGSVIKMNILFPYMRVRACTHKPLLIMALRTIHDAQLLLSIVPVA